MPYLITQRDDGSFSMEFEKSNPIYRSGKGKSEIIFPSDYVVVDLETTGLSAAYDEIIEIGCIRVRNGVAIDTYSQLVKPDTEIDEYISELTGITNEIVFTAPNIRTVLPGALEFIGEDVVVGHNVSFDVNFIFDVSASLLNKTFTNNYIDTMRIARKLFPEMPHHRLKDIAAKFGIVGEYHRSLNDCDITQKCFEALREEANAKYPTPEAFAAAFSPKVHSKLNARAISTDKTEFDEFHPLFGKLCVFTGVLEKMERKDAMQIVLDFGGECGNGVTAKTNYLILGNNDYCSSIRDGKSAKQKKAEALRLKGNDIEIIPENVFYDMIEG